MGFQELSPALQNDGRVGRPSETYYPLDCTALLGDVIGTHPTGTSIGTGCIMSSLVNFVLSLVIYWDPAVIVRYYGRSIEQWDASLQIWAQAFVSDVPLFDTNFQGGF